MLEKILPLLITVIVLVSCLPPEIPREALELSEENPARRKLQSRRFETKDEQALLSATSAVLKDLGFTIDQKSTELGLIAGSKKEEPYNIGGMATSAAVAVITSALSVPTTVPYSRERLIRASVATGRGENGDSTTVRLTLQLVVWNTEGKVAKSELLEEPTAYRAFFDKLSQSTSLEPHEF
ncbi:MAG: hypothetical protein ACREQP_19350 [Candidatus Binatia bacterium]